MSKAGSRLRGRPPTTRPRVRGTTRQDGASARSAFVAGFVLAAAHDDLVVRARADRLTAYTDQVTMLVRCGDEARRVVTVDP